MIRVSAKVDDAIRALVVLTGEPPRPIKGDRLAREHDILFRFLEVTLGELRQAGIVASRRGSEGGYWLARPATQISLEDVIVALEGSLLDVRSVPPEGVSERAIASRQISGALWDRAATTLSELFANMTSQDLANGAAGADEGAARAAGQIR